MKRAVLLLLAGIALVALGSVVGAGDQTARVPEGWAFTLPAGDAADGKSVFLRMECYSCHSVKIPGQTFPEGAGGIGPALTGSYAALPSEYLAESIIKAHTVVAAPGYVVREGQAGMGKYNHFMTVEELIDLVAFLRSMQ